MSNLPMDMLKGAKTRTKNTERKKIRLDFDIRNIVSLGFEYASSDFSGRPIFSTSTCNKRCQIHKIYIWIVFLVNAAKICKTSELGLIKLF